MTRQLHLPTILCLPVPLSLVLPPAVLLPPMVYVQGPRPRRQVTSTLLISTRIPPVKTKSLLPLQTPDTV